VRQTPEKSKEPAERHPDEIRLHIVDVASEREDLAARDRVVSDDEDRQVVSEPTAHRILKVHGQAYAMIIAVADHGCKGYPLQRAFIRRPQLQNEPSERHRSEWQWELAWAGSVFGSSSTVTADTSSPESMNDQHVAGAQILKARAENKTHTPGGATCSTDRPPQNLQSRKSARSLQITLTAFPTGRAHPGAPPPPARISRSAEKLAAAVACSTLPK
jgi:hypothetical protein